MIGRKNKKLKIAVIVGPFPSTSETFILNHITSLIDLGHEVDVFAFGQARYEQVVHESVTKYGLDKNVTYLFPIPYDRFVRFKMVVKILLRYGLVHPAWIYRCLKIEKFEKFSSLDVLILAGYFMKKRYDVLHCHFGTNAKQVCFLKDVLRPVKCIVTFHGYDIRRGLQEGKSYYKVLFEKADHVVSICDYNWEKLQELGCPKNKLVRLVNTIDTDLFSRSPRKNNGTVIITTVGRFVHEKNYLFALSIMKTLKDQGIRHFKYVVVGDGPLRREIEEKIREYHLEDYVELKGALKHEEVKDVLSQSDIFLLASRHEAFPIVVLEAQSMGIPVVATQVGGLDQEVQEGESGFLVPVNDPYIAADRLKRLIEDPNLRESFGQKGRKFVVDHFDIKKVREQLIGVYESQ